MKSFLLSSLIFIGTLNAQGPPAVPPQAPQAPPVNPDPAVVTPTNPNTNPSPPVSNPGQGGVTPQQPPATPQYGPPQQQPAPYNPYMNPYGGVMPMDPQELNCEFGQCRNRRITMSPGQGFKLFCKFMSQCDNLDLTLNIGFDPTSFGSNVNEINDLTFEAPQNGVTVRMNNMMPGQNIEVNNINCKTFGSCRNMNIIAGYGVELWEINVKCEVPGACTGCRINGQSCEMISMMTGNSGGGLAYGYGPYGGYTNTPNVPGAPGAAPQQPQAPGTGAPPMPQQGAPQYPQYPQYQPYPQWI